MSQKPKPLLFVKKSDAVTYWYDNGLDLEYSQRAIVKENEEGDFFLLVLCDGEFIPYQG